jgi:hypothetical protein
MKSRNAAKSLESNSRRGSNLTVRYGAIGISAVAAAMQCRGSTADQGQTGERGSGRSADHDAKWQRRSGPALVDFVLAG